MGRRVGLRFLLTPEELVGHFLKQRQLNDHFTYPDITDANIYKHHPYELPGLSSIESKEQVWYFFCTLNQKYPKSDRASRTAKGGSWKITGVDRVIKAKNSNKKIGTKKTLVFYNGCNTRKENKTNCVMHENHACPRNDDPLLKSKVVVCRIERKPDKKRTSSALDEGQPSDNLAYDSRYNVAEDIVPEVQPQYQHLPSSSNSHAMNNNHLKLRPQLNQHISSNREDGVAQNISSELEPPVPAELDAHIDCNGLDHNSFSTLQMPINSDVSNALIMWNTPSDIEQDDGFWNPQWPYQDEFFGDGIEHDDDFWNPQGLSRMNSSVTLSYPVFNSSKPVARA